MKTKKSEHSRVNLQQAAILSRFFKFREPCTSSIPSYTHKVINKEVVRFDFMLQVPTISHATDFLVRKGYYITTDNFDNDFSSLVFTKLKMVI